MGRGAQEDEVANYNPGIGPGRVCTHQIQAVGNADDGFNLILPL